MPNNYSGYLINPVGEHPLRFEQDELDEMWGDDEYLEGEPPHRDEVFEDYRQEIAKYGEWAAFIPTWPFGGGTAVYILNEEFEEGFRVEMSEGTWHQFVNFLAAVVEEEGDCREAEYSNGGVMPSGSQKIGCKGCGGSWRVG